VWLRCANGVHATIKDNVLTAEGVMALPFEHIENETDKNITLVFADAHTEAKVQIRYSGPAFYLKDTDGSWAPCTATKIPNNSAFKENAMKTLTQALTSTLLLSVSSLATASSLEDRY
jgi:hypothetical protein